MNIVLIGLRGSGKSTVAKVLAKKFNKILLETDDLAAKKAQAKITDIIRVKGINYFRRLETEILMALTGKKNCVIATGGGIIERKINRRLIKSLGTVIYLKVAPETAFQRIGEDSNRPILTGSRNMLEDLNVLYLKRKLNYEKISNLIIECDNKKITDIIKEIRVKIKI